MSDRSYVTYAGVGAPPPTGSVVVMDEKALQDSIREMAIAEGFMQEVKIPKRPRNQLSFVTGKLHITIVRYDRQHDDTTVTLGVALNDEVWEVTGTAHRYPDDIQNTDAAFLLALSRALTRVGRQIERHAEGQFKHDADMEAQNNGQTLSEVWDANPGFLASATKAFAKLRKRGTWRSGPR